MVHTLVAASRFHLVDVCLLVTCRFMPPAVHSVTAEPLQHTKRRDLHAQVATVTAMLATAAAHLEQVAVATPGVPQSVRNVRGGEPRVGDTYEVDVQNLRLAEPCPRTTSLTSRNSLIHQSYAEWGDYNTAHTSDQYCRCRTHTKNNEAD